MKEKARDLAIKSNMYLLKELIFGEADPKDIDITELRTIINNSAKEIERELLIIRAKAEHKTKTVKGIKKSRGRQPKYVLDQHQLDQIRTFKKQGKTLAEIAKELNLSVYIVFKTLKRLKL